MGFVALIDAASIIAAFELGYFAEEGVDVVLCREIGWANIRDKLAFNRLDASHALIGHTVRSAIGDGFAGVPLRSVMALGTGGDGITLSSRLINAGVTSAATLKQYVARTQHSSRPVFASVSESSVHHYLLRQWLSAEGIDPDEDVRLCVLPPPQMAAHMADRQIDGFCAGEPWNSLAHAQGSGRIVALTTDIVPAHPDKVLAVNQIWASQEPQVVEALVRAIIRGSQYCADDRNLSDVALMLSDSRYLGIPSETILSSLRLDRSFGLQDRAMSRVQNWAMRSFDTTFPSRTHAAWFVTQLLRWGHVPASTDPWSIAAQCTETATYRSAAQRLGVSCPNTDTPPMPLGNGKVFAPQKAIRPRGDRQIQSSSTSETLIVE